MKLSVVIPPGYEAVSEVSKIQNEEVRTMGSKLKSILSDVSTGLKKFFGVATTVAKDAEPFINIVFPGIAPLYNTTVSAIVTAEATATAAGLQSGTGAQKLAMVVASIQGSFNSYWASLGHATSPTQQQIESYVNAVVASLNAIPSPASTPAS